MNKDGKGMHINEVIIVEGRDDTAAIKRACDADTIETHGFGIGAATWDRIEHAHRTRGIIVFTDPDHAGENIRKRIKARFPDCKEANLVKKKASKDGDIGIENASPTDIMEALKKARAGMNHVQGELTMQDMRAAGLVGGPGARGRREKIADALGLGYANSAGLLARLNGYGITREEFYEAVRAGDDKVDQR